MRSLVRGRGWWIALALLVAAIVIGSLQQTGDSGRPPERQVSDEGAQGFAGWAELLRRHDLTVDELEHPPSSGEIDPDTTVIALDLGEPGEADIEALREFLEAGGYLITGGNTDADAVTEITGLDPSDHATASAPLTPLLPVAQTEGVASVDAEGASLFRRAGSGLPVVGAGNGDLLLLGGAGDGEVALLSSSDPLVNDRLTRADNAQFAIDLARAGEPENPVAFVESLARRDRPEEGLAALPGGWTAGFLGLLLAALTLIAARVRRLGPPDGTARPRARPRTDDVDALARVMERAGPLSEAAEPVRRAAVDAIARRSGGEPAGDDADMLAAQAELAGVPPEEAVALSAPLRESEDAIKAARALSRVRN